MARERLRVREISNQEGNRLLAIVRRSSGSVVTWRRAQMVLAVRPGHGRRADSQGVLHQSGPGAGRDQQLQPGRFDSLYPRYAGGRPPTFTLPQRQQVKKIALSRPVDHGLPFSTWSLTAGRVPSRFR